MALVLSERLQQANSELQKALTAVGAAGIALQPEDLEPALVEELFRLQPLLQLLPIKPARARVHEIARRTAHGAAVWEGELVDDRAAAVQSTYDRPTVTLKVLHFWGAVSGFQQAASARFIDSLQAEQQGALEAMSNQFEFMALWSNVIDSFFADGFDTLITTNITDHNGVVTLKLLDDMIDAATGYRGAQNDPAIFMASKAMVSKITGLQTLARIPVTTMEFEGGLRMESFRHYPLLETDYLKSPASVISDLAGAAAAGGSLADDEYFYKIAAIHENGEQTASNEDSATTATTNNSVALTWTADPNALLYKIYRGLTTGDANLSLLTTIAAKTRDSAGKITGTVAAFTDDGSFTAPTGGGSRRPHTATDEAIFFINLNPDRGASLVSLINAQGERVDNLISFLQLALTRSSFDFLMESFAALQVPWEKLHAESRRVRIS